MRKLTIILENCLLLQSQLPLAHRVFSMKKILNKIPSGVFSVIATIIVMYLLLIPAQRVESSWMSWFHFKHADKVAHVLLFMFLNLVYLYEYTKHRNPHHTELNKELALTAAAVTIGLISEALQLSLGWGRSFDQLDIIADIAGALIAFALMRWFGSHLLRKYLFTKRKHHRHHHRHHKKHNKSQNDTKENSQNG